MPFPMKYLPLMIALFLLGGVSAMSLYASQQAEKNAGQADVRRTRAIIGGAFTMIDHTGKTVTEKDYLGSYVLVYFGFTYCPDICPTELQVMTEALNMLSKKQSSQVKILLVSIDPERDTPKQLASYVSNFHANTIGLTGSAEQVKKMAKVYRAYYNKVPDKNNPDGYTMDHSSIIYLMGPDGKYLAHFPYGTRAKVMSEKIASFMGKN